MHPAASGLVLSRKVCAELEGLHAVPNRSKQVRNTFAHRCVVVDQVDSGLFLTHGHVAKLVEAHGSRPWSSMECYAGPVPDAPAMNVYQA